MKDFISLLLFAFIAFSFIPVNHFPINNVTGNNDTVIITHVIDGSIAEWQANSFNEDKEINIRYAVDNDSKNLYIAMAIPDVRTQMNVMSQGMILYIDTKGKKKETRGIIFPVNKTQGNFFAVNKGERQKPDIKQLRGMMVSNLLFLQLIGFTNDDPADQELMIPGSANIAYTWDDKDVMSIEYSIPYSLLSDNISLAGKTISLMWKINPVDAQILTRTQQFTTTTTTTTTVAGVPSGTPPPGRSRGQSFPSLNQPTPQTVKQQSSWIKYTVPAAK